MKFSVLFLSSVVVLVECSLPVEKTCGDTTCPDHYFCSPIDHHCRPCEEICDRNRSNYDYARCEAGCQDYLHDMTYLRRNESSTMSLNLATKDDVEILRTQLYILLFITFTILVLMVIFGTLKFIKFLNRRKRTVKKKTIAMPIIYNNKYGKEQEAKVIENNNENKRRSIRLEREPSESTLPDYSYDNPTLSVSHSPINTV